MTVAGRRAMTTQEACYRSSQRGKIFVDEPEQHPARTIVLVHLVQLGKLNRVTNECIADLQPMPDSVQGGPRKLPPT